MIRTSMRMALPTTILFFSNMIEELRSVETQLYDLLVREISDEQIREVEQEHKIKLCHKLRANETASELQSLEMMLVKIVEIRSATAA